MFKLFIVTILFFDLIVSLPVTLDDNDFERNFFSKNIENSSSTTSIDNITTTTTTEQPPIANVSVLQMTPDVNHALTIEHQNTVINLGQSLSMGITNAIVRPITFFNNLIGSAAGSLPGLFAANGAALGTAIATPIQLGTLAANAAISGITGTVVSIPISLASGGAAQLVGLVGTGRQILQNSLGTDPNNNNNSSTFWPNGELFLQPLAVVAGTNSILAGIGLNALSQGVKNIGWHIEQFGVSLSNTGKNAKQFGSLLIGWANGKPVFTPINNETLNLNITTDLKPTEQQSQLDHIISNIDFDHMIPLNTSEVIIETPPMNATIAPTNITNLVKDDKILQK